MKSGPVSKSFGAKREKNWELARRNSIGAGQQNRHEME
jgi:hypothetical protein